MRAKHAWVIAGAVLAVSPGSVSAQLPLGDCSAEPGLEGREGVIFCEPWESDTWWSDHGFMSHGGLTRREINPATELEYAALVDEGCVSGRCLSLLAEAGVSRSLSIDWPLSNADMEPEELYFRYYLRLGATWDPRQCDDEGVVVWPPGGKLPGLADPRTNSDPGGQCGNGGESSDGIRCWTARGGFHGCEGTGGADNGFPYDDTCDFAPGAITRIGSYVYQPGQPASTGSNGLWDFVAEDQTIAGDYSAGASCRRDDPLTDPPADCYCGAPNNLFCGRGTGGMLERERWYSIEMQVRMNTPGSADGVLRGWVDGVLSYEKLNMEYRRPGHDGLHVRTVWLNVYKGGTSGNCERGYVYLDNMVVSTVPIGPVAAIAPERDAGAEPDGGSDGAPIALDGGNVAADDGGSRSDAGRGRIDSGIAAAPSARCGCSVPRGHRDAATLGLTSLVLALSIAARRRRRPR
jgi:hypothetical protein